MNLVIADKKTKRIIHFIENCHKIGDQFVGTNKAVYGIKKRNTIIRWTNKILTPTETTEGVVNAWKETFNDIPKCAIFEEAFMFDDLPENDIEKIIDKSIIDLKAVKRIIIILLKNYVRAKKKIRKNSDKVSGVNLRTNVHHSRIKELETLLLQAKNRLKNHTTRLDNLEARVNILEEP